MLSPFALLGVIALLPSSSPVQGYAALAFMISIPVAAVWGSTLSVRYARRALVERRGIDPATEVGRAYAAPLLYLRSFPFDRRAGRLRLSVGRSLLTMCLTAIGIGIVTPTPEMALVRAVPRKIPILAIGKPGEKRPPLGALRFYVDHQHWQRQIELIVPNCQLVVWVTGDTPSLKWELDHLLSHLQPSQLILWSSSSVEGGSRRKRRSEWADFVTAYGSLFPKGLPPDGAKACFVIFEPDWTPVSVASRAFPVRLAERFHLGNKPISGFRSILRDRLAT
jgi:hypothetical protein